MRTSRTHSRSGFTIIELSASLTAMALVLATVGAILHRSLEGSAHAEARSSDIRQVRSAFSSIENDVRAASSASLDAGRLVLNSEGREVVYVSREEGLTRSEGAARRTWRALRGLEGELTGDLVRFRLELRRRTASPETEPWVLSSAARLGGTR